LLIFPANAPDGRAIWRVTGVVRGREQARVSGPAGRELNAV
jgi:hypothetical protein